MNFEPIISPVNRDFLFDRVNFIVEPLRVSVHVWVCVILWMHAELHGAMTLRSNSFSNYVSTK